MCGTIEERVKWYLPVVRVNENTGQMNHLSFSLSIYVNFWLATIIKVYANIWDAPGCRSSYVWTHAERNDPGGGAKSCLPFHSPPVTIGKHATAVVLSRHMPNPYVHCGIAVRPAFAIHRKSAGASAGLLRPSSSSSSSRRWRALISSSIPSDEFARVAELGWSRPIVGDVARIIYVTATRDRSADRLLTRRKRARRAPVKLYDLDFFVALKKGSTTWNYARSRSYVALKRGIYARMPRRGFLARLASARRDGCVTVSSV